MVRMQFELQTPFKPTGDQPQAIQKLVAGVRASKEHQTLLGVTGSGKTFTVANVIQQTKKPTLVIAHNKTLAAQLYQEFRDFFPNNAVSYFVSYYDYYQPEAYIPSTDTYIEKEATINDEIDKLRLATTTNLLTRPDVIVVASVSCIYNLGSPVEYGKYVLQLVEGELIDRETILLRLGDLQYDRSDTDLRRGSYRIRGDVIQLWPAYEDLALKIDTLDNKIVSINWIDPVTGQVTSPPHGPRSLEEGGSTGSRRFVIYPAKHYLINPKSQTEAFAEIRADLEQQVATFKAAGDVVAAYRIEQKVKYDLEMLQEFGFVGGIENYSRYFDGRDPGSAPFTLLDYFRENAKQFGDGKFLTVIDESHISLPQVRGMYNGDQARKKNLINYGFRLPSALDNRPLKGEEFMSRNPQIIYVSATPNEYEISLSGGETVEQLVRPTGLIDPEVELRPTEGQIEDLVIEIIKRKMVGQRTLVTTLTKRMAETLTEYLNDETKVTALVNSFEHKRRLKKEFPNPEAVVRANEQLDIEHIELGKIDPIYLNKAHIDSEFSFTSESLPKVAYLHSDIETLERSDILDDLRRGVYDVVVGINLLREGLDLPEVTLVAILDADKEGFLRSATSLVQTMGRAARHADGHVILYADNLTKSMAFAIKETYRRRAIQIAYNQTHNITPLTISKPIRERMLEKKPDEVSSGTDSYKKMTKKPLPFVRVSDHERQQKNQPGYIVQLSKNDAFDLLTLDPEAYTPHEKKQLATRLNRRMKRAADELDFELAAALRDAVQKLLA